MPYKVVQHVLPTKEYTLVFGACIANSAVGMLGERHPSSLSTDDAGEPPPSTCSSVPAADGASDPLPLELFENPPPRASVPICAAVSTDVGEPSSCSDRDCIHNGGFSSCLSAGTCFLAAPSTLRGYGCAGFLFGRGGGIWMAAAAAAADAPPEPVLLPEDSLTTCRAPRNHNVRKLCETTRSKNMTSSVLLSHEKKLKNWRLTLGNQVTQPMVFFFCLFVFSWQRSEIFCCCLHENERLYDLREELLRVATDLHGSLGTYVLCIHTQTNTNVTAHRRIRTIAIDRHENSICSMRHTLYTAPCAAVQLQGFQEQPVLLVRPLLALLRDRVRLSRLVGGKRARKEHNLLRGNRAANELKHTRTARDFAAEKPRFGGRSNLPLARALPLTNPCRRSSYGS